MKINFKIKSFWLSIILLVLLFVSATLVFALPIPQYYRVNHEEIINVDAIDGLEYEVTNLSAIHDYFIPNNTLAEWTAVKNAADNYLTDINIEEVVAELNPPTNFQITFSSPILGTATWEDNSEGEDGFQLDRLTPTARDQIAVTGSDAVSTNFNFKHCNGISTIDFRLRAFRGANFSDSANASALRPGFAAPTSLTTTFLNRTSMRLSWTPGTTGQSGYKIYRISPNPAEIGTVGATATTFEVTGLTLGTSYVFGVKPYVWISSPVDPPGGLPYCTVLGNQITVNYNPVYDLQIHLTNHNYSISQVDLQGIPPTVCPNVELTLVNSGSIPVTIGIVDRVQTAGSSNWTAPSAFIRTYNPGESQNATVNICPISTNQDVINQLNIRGFIPGDIGAILIALPIRMFVFPDNDPSRQRQFITTANRHNGNFANDASLVGATVQEKADYFCQIDPNTDDAKTWKALLWVDNSLSAGVISANKSYYNSHGQFMFGSDSNLSTLPVISQAYPCGVYGCGSFPVFTGRKVPSSLTNDYDCTNWSSADYDRGYTGNGGTSPGNSTHNIWSGINGGSAFCYTPPPGNYPPKLYCVEQ